VRDNAAPHQVDEKRRETRFDDVPAKHDDDAALAVCRCDERVDHRAEVSCDENVRQRFEKCVERPIVAGRMRELGRAHFVGAARNGNSSDGREIRFARG